MLCHRGGRRPEGPHGVLHAGADQDRIAGADFGGFDDRKVHREPRRRHSPHGAGLRKHRGAARRRGGQGHPSDRQDPPQGRRGHDHRLPAPEIDPGHSDGALRKQKQIGL